LATLTLGLPFLARATNHQLRMEEIMAGFNGDPSAQFIVMFVNGDGQKSWGPQGGESQSRALLEFFNGAGVRTAIFQIPNNPPPGRDTVLLATTAFANQSGLQPDIIIPPLISAGSGKVCFRGNLQNPNHFDVNLCLSYGNFPAALTEGAGSPAPGLPVAGEGRALRRFQNFGFGDETSRNADFRLAVPHPTNTAGQTFVFTVAGPAITLTPESVRFSSQDVGATGAVRVLTIRNFGTSNTLVLSNIVVGGAHGSDFRIVQDSGQTNLPPLATRTLRLQFVAGGTGTRLGALRVTSNDPDTPFISLPLQGHGLSTDPCDAPDLAGAGARDRCEDAMLIGPNIQYVDRIFGAENHGSSACTQIPFPDSPDADVFYRYIPGEDGDLLVILNTQELGFNPNQGGLVTLSIHRGCPATPENEITCTSGFPEASLGVFANVGQELIIRISAVDAQRGVLLTPTGTFELSMQGPPALSFDRNRNGRRDSCEFDFGDAPAPYPTLLAENGPRHPALSGLFLGSHIDPDEDGQPSARATGDNLDGSANDDDGITLLTPLIPGRPAALILTASGQGLVNAWIDFNADGDWNDALEQIVTNRVVLAGTNTITFAVPPGLQPTNLTFARFRLSSIANLAPTGPAPDGEVEDYAFEIQSPQLPTPGEPHVRINEILAGLNGDSTVQFIELQVAEESDKAWGPQAGETTGRGMLVFSDSNGRITGRLVFPSNAPAGADTVLVATREFAQQTGLVPDFFMPPELMAVRGQVAFRPNPSNDVFSVDIALSYGGGGFLGETAGAGPPNPAELPIMDARSLGRVEEVPFGLNLNLAFRLGAPSPRNTKGQTVTLGVRPVVEQGRVLFSRETFNGNGRTCQTCHLPGRDQFGLTPQTIAGLPSDDPLFVFESNVNLMRLATWSQPSDLRGVITGDSGSGRILAGSGDTFLVLGGTNLTGRVRDTNGNSATVVAVNAGDLGGPTPSNGSRRGLEDGAMMRSGRALILENIDGFARREVFRASPHLLNIRLTAPYGLSGEFDNLRDFSDGAVAQHFPRSLSRISDVDFRHPTPAELTAMEAFMNTISHPPEQSPLSDLDRFVTTEAQKRGRALFFSDSAKCFKCHSGPTFSQSDGSLQGSLAGVNDNFNTGVANLQTNQFPGRELPTEPAGLPAGESTRAFNTPPLFGLRLTAPFFHDGSAATIREAVRFYDSEEFVASPAGALVGAVTAANDPDEVDDLVAFLESLVELPVDFPRQLTFGVSCPNLPPPATVTASITNRSSNVVHLLGLQLTGTNASEFRVVGESGNTNLAPGEVRRLDLLFQPSGFGLREATLELTASNEELGTFSFGMSLRGAKANATAVFNARPLDFGPRDIDAGLSTNQSITLSNAGPGELLVLDARLVGSGATNFAGFANGDIGQPPGIFPSILVSSPVSLSVGQQLSFLVFFGPQRQGPASAQLRIETASCNASVTEVALSGVGTATVSFFGWEPISSPQLPNAPFDVRVTARDHNNELVQNFNGTVHLATLAPTNRVPSVLLSEIDPGNVDRVELINLSGQFIDVTGWELTCFDPDPKRFVFPPMSLPSDAVITVREQGVPPGNFPNFFLGTNLFWIGNSENITVVLRDNAGRIVDFFTTDTGPIPPEANPGNAWLGPGVPAEVADGVTTYQRVGVADHDDAGDWVVAESTPSSINPALFSFGLTPFGIANLLPDEAQLVNGTWNGSLRIPIEGAGLRLAATDGNGRSGISQGIDVIGQPPSIGSVPAQVTTDEDVLSPPITFTIGDVGTPLQRLLLSIRSSNSNLVNNSGALFGGSGTQRTLQLLPVTNQFGSAVITIDVSDGVSVASASFELSVRPVADPPFLKFGLSMFTETFERALAPELPSGWRNDTGLLPNHWTVSTLDSHSPPQAAFVPHLNSSSEVLLVSPFIQVPVNGAVLEFVHNFATVQCCDIGFLQFSVDDSEFEFNDVTAFDVQFLEGGYQPGVGWFGNQNGFIRTRLRLPGVANGHNIRLRWRFLDGGGVQPSQGWFIDDVRVRLESAAPGQPQLVETDEDVPLVFSLVVQDPESLAQDVTLSITSSNPDLLPPTGITIEGTNELRTVRLTPGRDKFGVTDLTLRLSDGALETIVPVRWTVHPVDDPPKVAPIANFSVLAGTRIDFVVQATNDDNPSELSFTLEVGPTGASIDPVTGRFTWRPTPLQTGLNAVSIRVSEESSGTAVVREFQVTVVDLPLQFTSVADFGSQCGGGPVLPPMTLGLTNISTNSLFLAPQPLLVGSNSSLFHVVADSGQTTLNPGEFRLLQVSYTPVALGSNLAELELGGSNSVLGTFTAATILNGRFATSRFFVTNVLDFGQTDITNFGVALSFNASSTGSPLPTVFSPQIIGTNRNDFFFEQLFFDPTNASRLIFGSVRFRPLTRGFKTAILRFQSDACQNPVVDVVLRGTATSGVDHFLWELSTEATSNVPFPARLLALDRNGERIENFNSTASISIAGTQPVLITEIDPGEPDRVEFANVSTQPVNLGGWSVILYDPLPIIRSSLVLPNVVLAPGAVFTVSEGGTVGGAFPNFFTGGFLDWFGFSGTIGVMLRNNAGVVADFAATSQAIGVTSPIRLPATEWLSGIPPGLSEGLQSYQRVGSSDNNSGQDWESNTPLNFGVLNPDLVVPFDVLIGPATLRSPGVVIFTNGLWAGSLTISNEAAGVRLAAVHPSGVAGMSAPINILGTPPVLAGLPATVTLDEDSALPAIDFTVGDAEMPLNRLRVNLRSSNPTLFPRSNLSVFGTNTDRQLRGMPATNRAGSASIFIEVSDGAQTVTGRVSVVVRPINDAPFFPTNTSSLIEDFDRVTPPLLPTGWVTTSQFGGQIWRTSTASVESPPNAAFINDAGFGTDTSLTSPFFTIPAGTPRLRFRHSFSTESCCDGGFVEINTGNGFNNIINVGSTFISNGYNAGFSWRGTSAGNITTVIQLPSTFTGQTAQFRWRFTTDGSVSGVGWFIDNITFGEDAVPFPTTVTIDEDSLSPPVLFSIDDIESGPDDLRVSVTSSNPALVPNEGLSISGAGRSRALAIHPVTNQFGTASLIITANDGLTNVSRSIALTVLPVNDPPQMAPLPDLTVHAGTPLALPVLATDVDSPLLTYSITSAGPPQGAQLNPTNGLFTWTPSRTQVGRHPLTFVVSDKATPPLSDARSFAINVLDFAVRPLSIALNGVVTLSWSAMPGATYLVQFKDDLNAPTWNDLPGLVTATGELATRTDTAPIGNQRWYRIVQMR
jgi:hypothetical protein